MSDPIFDKLKASSDDSKVMPDDLWNVWIRLANTPGLSKLYDQAMKRLLEKPDRDTVAIWLKRFFAAGHIAATDLPPELPDASKIVEEMAKDLAIHFTDKERK
jgi:hypothetical protein